MVRQRLALRQRACGLCNGDWMTLLDLADIAFEVVKSEHQLVIVQAFGPAAELCPLKLLDDRLEPLDLTIAVLNDSCHIAHKMLQKSQFGGQIVEIDSHVRFCVNARIGPNNFPADNRFFSLLSPGRKRPPEAFRCTPVDALDQHGELRWRQCHRAARLCHARPQKLP